VFEFDACIFDGELPVDTTLFAFAFCFPDRKLPGPAPPRLGYGGTGIVVSGCSIRFRPCSASSRVWACGSPRSAAAGLGRFERLIQGTGVARVQVVHHQGAPFRLRGGLHRVTESQCPGETDPPTCHGHVDAGSLCYNALPMTTSLSQAKIERFADKLWLEFSLSNAGFGRDSQQTF